jgi:hypothetical protein
VQRNISGNGQGKGTSVNDQSGMQTFTQDEDQSEHNANGIAESLLRILVHGKQL